MTIGFQAEVLTNYLFSNLYSNVVVAWYHLIRQRILDNTSVHDCIYSEHLLPVF